MLKNTGLFAELEEDELQQLSDKAVIRMFPKSSIIINEGDQSDKLHVVVEGRVKVFLSDEDGREIVLNTHGPGEHFGEVAMFNGTERTASVMTLEKSRLAMIARQDFEDCLCRNPRLALQMIRELAARLRTSSENVRSLALMDVYGRVARLLLQLAEDDDGQLVVKDRLTHQDIADRVGSSREMISRILKDLKVGGYIEIQDRRISIRSKLPQHW